MLKTLQFAINEVVYEQFKDCPTNIRDEAIEANVGGKRFRALRFLSESKKDLTDTGARNIAIAIELFQTAMLIHDDIIDRDDLRRGKPSTFKAVGEDNAIVVGDLMLSLSDSLFYMAISDHENYLDLHQVWSQMKRDVMVGQFLDIEQTKLILENLSDTELTIAKSNAYKICELKTASYTTVAPTLLGRVYAGLSFEDASSDLPELLNEGVEFQLKNDLDGFEKDKKANNISSYMVLNYKSA